MYINRHLKHGASLLVFFGLLILALGSTDSGSDESSSSNQSSPKIPDKIEAWVMTQQFVKDNLKSPSSADFGGVFGDYQDPYQIVTDLGEGKFRVQAWVDAQNSFGAKIRNRFVCELEYVGNNRWRMTNLAFLD